MLDIRSKPPSDAIILNLDKLQRKFIERREYYERRSAEQSNRYTQQHEGYTQHATFALKEAHQVRQYTVGRVKRETFDYM